MQLARKVNARQNAAGACKRTKTLCPGRSGVLASLQACEQSNVAKAVSAQPGPFKKAGQELLAKFGTKLPVKGATDGAVTSPVHIARPSITTPGAIAMHIEGHLPIVIVCVCRYNASTDALCVQHQQQARV